MVFCISGLNQMVVKTFVSMDSSSRLSRPSKKRFLTIIHHWCSDGNHLNWHLWYFSEVSKIKSFHHHSGWPFFHICGCILCSESYCRDSGLWTNARLDFNHGSVISDFNGSGTEFGSKLFQELCHVMNIAKIRTSVYHPSTNSIVERFHRSLKWILAKIMNDHQSNWDDYVPFAISAYNNSKQASANKSPNKLILAKRSPIR